MTDQPTPPGNVTDEQLRQAGMSPAARNYPRSEAGLRWLCAFNRMPDGWPIPAAWHYASNAYMHEWVERMAALGVPSTDPCPVREAL